MTGPESRLAALQRPTPARFAHAMVAFVTAMAIGVLLGWTLGLPQLTSGLPGLVQTKVNAAICLLCLAASLGLVATAPRKRRPIVWALSGLAVAIASTTLFEHFSGISLGIDQLFVTDQASATSPHPGRFAVQTSVAFCAAALACVSMGRSIRGIHPAEVLAVACGVVGGVSLLGYLYGARVLLSLDRGPGVDPAESHRLFELFYRSRRTSRIAGSGIGLFVALRLVESMGGTIWARPREDGEGAEFGFRLQPVREDA